MVTPTLSTAAPIATRSWVRVTRGLAALLGLVTLSYQIVDTVLNDLDGLGNLFFYFTIESNIFITVVLAVGAVRPVARTAAGQRRWDFTRGLAAYCIVITGLIFNVMLRSVDVGIGIDWVSEVEHVLLPLIGLLDWIVVRPAARLGYGKILHFLWVPLGYAAMSLVRGAIVGWYPYPFIDPTEDAGYVGVLINCLVIAAGMAALALAFAWIGNRGQRASESHPVTITT